MTRSTVWKLCWHVHDDKLVEVLTEPLATRIAYIKATKPDSEQTVRLRRIRLVKGRVPSAVVQAAYAAARAAHTQAGAAYAKAVAAYNKAGAAYAKAVKNNPPALEALHAKECKNCPWDGKTLFPVTR